MTIDDLSTTALTSGRPPAPNSVATPPPRARRERAWSAIGWAAVAVMSWLTISRWLAISAPARVTVLLQSLLPLVYVPAWPFAFTGLLRRQWALGGACVLLIFVQLAALDPAIGSKPVPAWATTAPRLRLLSANLYDDNPTPEAAAQRVMAADADVAVLVEVSPRMQAALAYAGLDSRYPYHSTNPVGRSGNVDGIWSRLPLDDERYFRISYTDLPTGLVHVGNRSLRVIGVHIDSALHNRVKWAEELDKLRQVVRALRGPLVVSGDFNATRWNPPFGELLATGLADAHEATGKGLSFSWPVDAPIWAPLAPLMRIDHALVNHDVAPIAVHDVTMPGSDHRAFMVELAVKPA
jgi:endonuclease/exonuclease/phosphatase (EEP) superfamily protein YafD